MLNLFVSIQNRLAELRDEEGQTMAEYGVILALITVAVVLTIGLLGTAINDAFQSVLSNL
jgi:pilus assembly protein Flp/PilA